MLSVPLVSSVDDDGSVGKRTRKGRKTDAQAGKVRYKLFLLIVEYNFKISVKNRPKMAQYCGSRLNIAARVAGYIVMTSPGWPASTAFYSFLISTAFSLNL